MKPRPNPLPGSVFGNPAIVIWSAMAGMAAFFFSAAAVAQTGSANTNATTYGARLDSKDAPAGRNPKRINNRINNRIETRLGLRIERYHPTSAADPAAAFRVQPTDNTRVDVTTDMPSPDRPALLSTTASPLATNTNDDSAAQTPR
jgi:hypothetical protein